jgi:hypothetical protein
MLYLIICLSGFSLNIYIQATFKDFCYNSAQWCYLTRLIILYILYSLLVLKTSIMLDILVEFLVVSKYGFAGE